MKGKSKPSENLTKNQAHIESRFPTIQDCCSQPSHFWFFQGTWTFTLIVNHLFLPSDRSGSRYLLSFIYEQGSFNQPASAYLDYPLLSLKICCNIDAIQTALLKSRYLPLCSFAKTTPRIQSSSEPRFLHARVASSPCVVVDISQTCL